jgi:hypothetical protein
MNPAIQERLATLLTALAMACFGCAHTQRPERRTYVIHEDARSLNFNDMDSALDWLRNNTADAPPGTSVVVAGVVFVIAIAAGALVLSPI